MEAAAGLDVPPPKSTLFCEIPHCAPRFADGEQHRTWDAAAAALIHRAFDLAAGGLEASHQAVIAFGDAVYDAAVHTAGWPADLVGPRCDGWHMSEVPPDVSAARATQRS